MIQKFQKLFHTIENFLCQGMTTKLYYSNFLDLFMKSWKDELVITNDNFLRLFKMYGEICVCIYVKEKDPQCLMSLDLIVKMRNIIMFLKMATKLGRLTQDKTSTLKTKWLTSPWQGQFSAETYVSLLVLCFQSSLWVYGTLKDTFSKLLFLVLFSVNMGNNWTILPNVEPLRNILPLDLF